MKKQTWSIQCVLFLATIVLASCQKQNDLTGSSGSNVQPRALLTDTLTGKYGNGFFLINEGWYGHGTGEVSFYRRSTGTKSDGIFKKENPGKNLNPATSTLEFATIFDNKLYLVSKVGGPVVVTDPVTLVETGRIAAAGGNDWRAFAGVDNTHGLISSHTGVFPVSLPGLTLGTRISGITGEVGDMVRSGNYVFVLSQSAGVVVLNASTYAIVKTIGGMAVAFARTSDGTVWAAGGTSLLKINPTTLDTATVHLPFTANNTWFAWHPGSITASTAENAVFIAANGTFSGGTAIYKYVVGTPSSLSAPFITIAGGKELYGAGIGYDPAFNQLIVTTVQSGFGTNYGVNDLVFYNAGTGALVSDLGYSGYYFPAIPVFH